jgi:hypothetical protein
MLLSKLSKAIGSEIFFAGQALSPAFRALVVASALAAAPAMHADCLPSVPAGSQVPFSLSVHNSATRAVGYASGSLIGNSNNVFFVSGDNFSQLFSDRFAPCVPAGCLSNQPFDVNQADLIGLTIKRTIPTKGHQSNISVALTLDSWGHANITFVGVCDPSTNLLYGSFNGNGMAVISFGTPSSTK